MDLPAELPETPKGWTRQLSAHYNFGRRGGAGVFAVRDETGMKMPISYQYNTCKGGLTGFTLPGVKGVMTWLELRAKWREWIKERSDWDNAERNGERSESDCRAKLGDLESKHG